MKYLFHRRRCEDEDAVAGGFVLLSWFPLWVSSMSRQAVKTAVLTLAMFFVHRNKTITHEI